MPKFDVGTRVRVVQDGIADPKFRGRLATIVPYEKANEGKDVIEINGCITASRLIFLDGDGESVLIHDALLEKHISATPVVYLDFEILEAEPEPKEHECQYTMRVTSVPRSECYDCGPEAPAYRIGLTQADEATLAGDFYERQRDTAARDRLLLVSSAIDEGPECYGCRRLQGHGRCILCMGKDKEKITAWRHRYRRILDF